MHIRPYLSEDRAQVVALLKQHIPTYFAPAEEADFIEYLDQHREDYFVIENNGQIIGAGGINYFPAERLGRISWDFVHQDFTGQGIGSQLLRHRLNLLSRNPTIDTIIVRTSQLAYPFYQKAGFQIEKSVKDFWAPGYDLVQMRLEAKTG